MRKPPHTLHNQEGNRDAHHSMAARRTACRNRPSLFVEHRLARQELQWPSLSMFSPTANLRGRSRKGNLVSPLQCQVRSNQDQLWLVWRRIGRADADYPRCKACVLATIKARDPFNWKPVWRGWLSLGPRSWRPGVRVNDTKSDGDLGFFLLLLTNFNGHAHLSFVRRPLWVISGHQGAD